MREPEPAPAAVPRTIPETRGPSHPDLSALTAARSLVNLSVSTDPTAVATAIPSSGPRLAPGGSGAAQDDPLLTRRSDGSYSFRGEGIRATIHPDGDVSFADRLVSDPEVRAEAPIEPPVQAVPVGQETKSTIFAVATVQMKFDLTGPHSAERRWFLDRTRQLREELVRKEAQRRLRELSGVCERIWSDGAASFAERRRKTFALWDSMADDELGAQGRTMISEFVRRRCPQDSGCAFGAEELTRLNRGRGSRAAFAPYGSVAETKDREP